MKTRPHIVRFPQEREGQGRMESSSSTQKKDVVCESCREKVFTTTNNTNYIHIILNDIIKYHLI